MTLKILHIVYNLIRGGTEGQCAQTVMGLARRGVPGRVAVFRREGFYLEAVEAAFGSVHEIHITGLLSANTIREVKRLRDLIQRENVHMVHGWDADANIFGGLAARWAKVPYITSRRDLGQIYSAHKLWLMRCADCRAERVVVNAAIIGKELVSQGCSERQIVHIPNIIDVKGFDSQAEHPFPREDILPGGRLIVMVARLDPEKDAGSLIRAFEIVANKVGNAFLVLAGDGPERVKIDALAKSLRVADRVVLLGDVTDVPALLRKAEIGVLIPASNEGSSNSIIEYLAAGLPVVATDCGGNRELLEDGKSGILVPPCDPEAMAQALGWLLDNPEQAKRMGRLGRERVERVHNPEFVLDRFEELYRDARLSSRGASRSELCRGKRGA